MSSMIYICWVWHRPVLVVVHGMKGQASGGGGSGGGGNIVGNMNHMPPQGEGILNFSVHNFVPFRYKYFL